jgi:hypothetical protein
LTEVFYDAKSQSGTYTRSLVDNPEKWSKP